MILKLFQLGWLARKFLRSPISAPRAWVLGSVRSGLNMEIKEETNLFRSSWSFNQDSEGQRRLGGFMGAERGTLGMEDSACWSVPLQFHGVEVGMLILPEASWILTAWRCYQSSHLSWPNFLSPAGAFRSLTLLTCVHTPAWLAWVLGMQT